MNIHFKLIFLLTIGLLLFSCVSRQESAVKQKTSKTNLAVQVIGVGYTEDIALTDSYSTYNAIKHGVRFQIKNGDLKLQLASGVSINSEMPSIETLTNSSVEKLENAFYVYSYPFSTDIEISGYKLINKSVSILVAKPFSFLSRMLAKAVMDEYGASKKKVKGKIFILKLDRQTQPDKTVLITSDIVLSEDAPEKF